MAAVPTNWSMVRVYGYLTDDDNDALSTYKLRATSTAPRLQDTVSNRVMMPDVREALVGSDGYFYWDQLSDTDTDVKPLPRTTKITLLQGTREVQSWWVTVDHSKAQQVRFSSGGAVVTTGGTLMDAVTLTSLDDFSSAPPALGSQTVAQGIAALKAEADPFTQYATNDELAAAIAAGGGGSDLPTRLRGWTLGEAFAFVPTRTDTVGTTSGSATVTDTAITARDRGRPVSGAGIPAGSYVGTVTAGASFLLSSSPTSQTNVNATATGASVSATLLGAARDSNGAALVAPIVWPDLSVGVFTGTPSTNPAALQTLDAFTATYVPSSGPTKTITQPAMTRDANGAVVSQPALTIA